MKELQQYDGNQVVSWDKCDWKPKEVSAPSKVLKMSGAIRIGCVVSSPSSDMRNRGGWTAMEGGRCFSCVLGAAYLGAGHTHKERMDSYGEIQNPRLWAPSYFGVPDGVIRDIHVDYEAGLKTREQCADWLESQGY